MTVEEFLNRYDHNDGFSKNELQRFITDHCECVRQEFYPRGIYSLIENSIVFTVAGRFFNSIWTDWLGTRESEDAWDCADKDMYLNEVTVVEVVESIATVKVYNRQNT